MPHFVTKALFSPVCQHFQNGPDNEFYGLKASQMSKIRANSHEYPHVEKFKNLREQNFKGEAN